MTADRIAELELPEEPLHCAVASGQYVNYVNRLRAAAVALKVENNDLAVAYKTMKLCAETAEAERDGHKANYLSELDRRVRAEAENIILHEEVLISNGKLLQAEAALAAAKQTEEILRRNADTFILDTAKALATARQQAIEECAKYLEAAGDADGFYSSKVWTYLDCVKAIREFHKGCTL